MTSPRIALSAQHTSRLDRRRGLTLFELIIGMVVMLVLLTLAVPTFRGVLGRSAESTAPGMVTAAQLEARRLSVTSSMRFPTDVVERMDVAGGEIVDGGTASTDPKTISALRIDEFTLVLATAPNETSCLVLVDSVTTTPTPPATSPAGPGWGFDGLTVAGECTAENAAESLTEILDEQAPSTDPHPVTVQAA